MTEDETVGWHHHFSGHRLSELRKMVEDGEACSALQDCVLQCMGSQVRHSCVTEQLQGLNPSCFRYTDHLAGSRDLSCT